MGSFWGVRLSKKLQIYPRVPIPATFSFKNEGVVISARQMNSQLLEQNRRLKQQNEELTRTNNSLKFSFQRDGSKLVKMSNELMIEITFLHSRTRYLNNILKSMLHLMRTYVHRMGAKYPAPINLTK